MAIRYYLSAQVTALGILFASSVPGCHRKDSGAGESGSFAKRLELSISDLENQEGGRRWEISRRQEVLPQLKALRGKSIDHPVVLYAARIMGKPQYCVVVIDYVDLKPQSKAFNLYIDDQIVLTLVEEDGSRQYDLQNSGVYYSALCMRDSSDCSVLEGNPEVYVELENPDGKVSNRVKLKYVDMRQELADSEQEAEE